MKALEKDRSRRYETANGLAMDLQRYLADEPVLACPPSAGYRLRTRKSPRRLRTRRSPTRVDSCPTRWPPSNAPRTYWPAAPAALNFRKASAGGEPTWRWSPG